MEEKKKIKKENIDVEEQSEGIIEKQKNVEEKERSEETEKTPKTNEKEHSDEKDENKKKLEEEKIVDMVEPEEIYEKEKSIFIQLDDNFKKHIEGKFFMLDKKSRLNFTFLYNKIIKQNLLEKLDIFYRESNAVIYYKNTAYTFFYKLIQVEFKFLYKDKTKNKIDKFYICSSCELLDYCKQNKYNPYIEINNKKYKFKYLFDFNSTFTKDIDIMILVQDYSNYDVYKKESLPLLFPKDNAILEPKKLSKFFELFFKFETRSSFEYWGSEKRNDFIEFIIKYKTNIDLHCFKICGPSGIGKSMTLFLISKHYYNFLYYNLKTIRDLERKNDNEKIQNILIESCKYLRLDENGIEQLSSLFDDNRIYPFFHCLKKIVEFLINKELLSVVILDQFKSDTVDKTEYNQISNLISGQKNKIVKLLICSSTNDKDIREECIKSWGKKIFYYTQYNKENQKYYFYIDELYNIKEKGNTSYDLILKEFNYIPKYRNKFKYLKNEENYTEKLAEDIKTIKINVEKNLKDLYKKINETDISDEIITMKMIESLRYLHLNIGEKIDYKKLSEFLIICSFKYYRFKFEQNYFMFIYNFPFMSEIVNDIIDIHLEEFYKYKLKDEHSGSANSDFFELFSGKSLRNGILKLPESEKSICIKVKEIVEMKEFPKDEIDNLINSTIYSNLEECIIKKEDFTEKGEIDKELNDRKLLLNLNDIIDYNDKNIEYYKLQYLQNLKQKYSILGNKKIGDMSIFINQKNERGRELDLAYVYGKKEEKTFIGFQMKAYDEEASHSCKFEPKKDKIKNILKPMIINIKYLMNMDIKSWHYIAVLLYDKRKKEGKQYFKNIVEGCQKNGIEYIFYEPYENKFYDRNFKVIITEYIPNQFSNLDNNIENILPINIMDNLNINIYMENFSKYLLENQLSNANYIKEGLNALLKKKRKRDINEISTIKEKQKEIRDALDSISSNIKLKFNFKTIKFVAAYEIIKTFNFSSPKMDYFFIYLSKEEDICFLIFNLGNMKKIYYKYNMGLTIDILDNKQLSEVIKEDDAFSIIENMDKFEQFYVFKFTKI